MSRPAKYDLIAIDLDGTLLNSRAELSAENVAAVRRAREAGLGVTICTGRGLVECRRYLEELGQEDPVAVAGGAIIACPRTRATLHRFSLGEELVHAATAELHRAGHAALVLKDPALAGYDYLVVSGEAGHELDPVTRWWFEKMHVSVRTVRSLAEDEHPEHTVRVGGCGPAGRMAHVSRELQRVFAGRFAMHHFSAVVAPEHARRWGGGEPIHVLEIFDTSANKWSAISELARAMEIRPERIAAIGDEINDVPMIENAGLGVAMGNAIAAVRERARRQTLHHDEHGVAHAIDMILAQEW